MRRERNLPAIPLVLLLGVLLFVLFLGVGQGRAQAVPAFQPAPDQQASPRSGPAEDGEALFQSTCSACHSVGGGDDIGPDLQDVAVRRDPDWLTRWLTDPPKMISDGDPIATEMLGNFNNVPMPNFNLSEQQISSLIAFFEAQAGGAPPQQAAPATTQASGDGDAAAGKNLFTGVTRLANGGPSCRACHSSGGIGGLGGGKLGPDLTGAHAKLGDALIQWPSTVQPMLPIYSSKPLTPDEQVQLIAFFRSTDVTTRSTEVIWQLVALAVGGVVVIGVVAQLIWRRRLSKVREPMVSRQRAGD
ncbi:MAG TPA: cytochrome c [Dehalococcoidia bacterium]|nr:cytochrome c [Dehalococcoidia bacterium]